MVGDTKAMGNIIKGLDALSNEQSMNALRYIQVHLHRARERVRRSERKMGGRCGWECICKCLYAYVYEQSTKALC